MSKDTSETIIKHTIIGLKETERLALATDRLSKSYDKLCTSMTGLSSGTGKIKDGITQTGTATEKATKQAKMFGVTWQGVQRIILASLVARAIGQIVSALSGAIDKAKEFQIHISEIRTIAQDNQRSFNIWSKAVKELSDEFGNPILETAEAHYQTLSNQIAKGAEVTDFTREANLLALATTASLDEAVLALSGTLNAYGKSSDYAREESAKLFKTIELGRLRLNELAPSIGRVSVLAAQMGVNSEEVYAALATLTIKGMKVNEAMSGLRVVFMKLIRPTVKMQELLDSWGTPTAEAAIETFGFVGVLRKLAKYAGDAESPVAALAEAINRIRGTTAGVGLVQGLEKFEDNLAKIINAAETYEEALKIMQESPGFQFQREMTRIANVFTTEFGPKILNVFVNINESVGGLAKAISALGFVLVEVAKFSFGLLIARMVTSVRIIDGLVLSFTALRGSVVATSLVITKLKAAFIALAAHPVFWAFTASYAITTTVLHFTKGVGKMKDLSEELTDKIKWESEKRIRIIEKESTEMAEAVTSPITEQINLMKTLFNMITKFSNEYKELGNLQLEQDERIYRIKLKIAEQDGNIGEQRRLMINAFIEARKGFNSIEMNNPENIKNARKELDKMIEKTNDLLDLGEDDNRAKRVAITALGEIEAYEDKIAKHLERSGDQRKAARQSITSELGELKKSIKVDQDINKQLNDNIKAQKDQNTLISDRKKDYESITNQLKENIGHVEQLFTLGSALALDPRFGDRDRATEEVKNLKQDIVNLTAMSESLNAAQGEEYDRLLENIRLKVSAIFQEVNRLKEKGVLQIEDSFQADLNALAGIAPVIIDARNELERLKEKQTELENSFEGIRGVLHNIISEVSAARNGMVGVGEAGANQIDILITALEEVAYARLKNIRAEVEATKKTIEALERQKEAAVKRWTGGYISRFASGGSVASDSIQALLSPGEFVVNKNAARQFLPQLVAMNSGAARFSAGGEVVNNNIGDINVTVQGNQGSETTARQIAVELRREIRRGTARLN